MLMEKWHQYITYMAYWTYSIQNITLKGMTRLIKYDFIKNIITYHYTDYVLDKSLCPLFWNLLFLMMLSRMFVSIQNQGSYYVTILHLIFKMSTIPGMVGGACLLLLLLSPSSSSHFIPMWLRYLCKKLYSYLKYFSRNKTSLNTARCHVTAILFTFAS